MAGGGMGASAPTGVAQMSGSGFMGGLSAAPQSTAPAAPPTPDAAPTAPASLQFGTAGTGTGIVEAPQQSPMTQQMQSQAPMQNPYARPMPQQMYRPQMMQQQQPMYRPQMAQQSQYGGLQSLLMNLINRYQQPQQRVSQMPQYQSSGLGYRPNLAQSQANLSRTGVTQAQAQAAAEAAARAKLGAEMGISGEDADFLRWQRQQYEASRNSFNSGG